jgi:hypothetical protein
MTGGRQDRKKRIAAFGGCAETWRRENSKEVSDDDSRQDAEALPLHRIMRTSLTLRA